jgi:hypothetical protein
MSEPSEEKEKEKTFDEIVDSIDLESLTVKDILGDLFRSFQYISTRVAVAIRLLEKMENKNNDGVS